MRDFLGKILPGFMLFFLPFIAHKTFIQPDQIFDVPLWVLMFFIGIFWLVGFVVQGIGALTGSIQFWDRAIIAKRSDWLDKYRTAHRKDKEIGDFERLIVIKEALGNFFVSLLFGGTIAITFLVDSTKIPNSYIFALSAVLIVLFAGRKILVYLIEKNEKGKGGLLLNVSVYIEDFVYAVIAVWLFTTKPWNCDFKDSSELTLIVYFVFLIVSHQQHLIHLNLQTQWAVDLSKTTKVPLDST